MTNLQSWVNIWWNWICPLTWQLALFVILVTVTTVVLRKSPPVFRYGLWLLVLIRVFLPPGLSAPWSPGDWIQDSAQMIPVSMHTTLTSAAGVPTVPRDAEQTSQLPQRMFGLWLLGCVISTGIVTFQYRYVVSKTRRLPSLDEGPVKIAAERAALDLGVTNTPEIYISDETASPFLIGILKPGIVLPQSFIEGANEQDLSAILQHEIVHWKHRDTWIGLLQVIVQCLLWFHPMVWFANARLRHERETTCDAAVLQAGVVRPEQYGETLLRVLTLARGRSLVKGSLVGVFEQGGRIQDRLESVMQFKMHNSNHTWSSSLAVTVFGLMFMPMAPWTSSAETVAAAETSQTTTSSATETQDSASNQALRENDTAPKTTWPILVKTTPAAGATDVDPALKMIRVEFDRDMGTGMSWTGGGPEFPQTDPSMKARWLDKRTCVLPVQLQRSRYYRLGINSKSYLNFKAADGTPTPPTAIFFTTRGASTALKNRVRIPKVVNLSPAANTANVSPTTAKLVVTFNMPMGKGMSWTGGGEHFPKIPDGHKPEWSRDGRTCTLPVSLIPNHDYQLGLNSLSHNNFQSKWGVPLKPIIYRFHTATAKK